MIVYGSSFSPFVRKVLVCAAEKGIALDVKDPVLRARRSQEAPHLRELATHVGCTAIEPWRAGVFDDEATRLGGLPGDTPRT